MQFTAPYAAGDRRTLGRGRSSYRRQCADARRERRAAGSVTAVGRVLIAKSRRSPVGAGCTVRRTPARTRRVRRVNGSLVGRRTASTAVKYYD